MSRSTIITSASGGLPDKPSRVAVAPLVMVPPERVGSCGRWTISASHHLRVAHGVVGIGEGHGAGLGEQADLRQFLALEAHRQRAIGIHVRKLHLARAARHELDQRGIVERRFRVGQQHHRGDAADRSRHAGAFQRFLVLLARLAGMDARIDHAGREIEAAAVDRLDAVGCPRGEEVGAEIGDLAVADQDGAEILAAARRIDDAGVDVGRRAGVRRGGLVDLAAHSPFPI
jgi:hypothetical protein